MLRLTLIAAAFLVSVVTDGVREVRAAQSSECLVAKTRVPNDPCLVIQRGKAPVRKPYPINQLLCIDYRKLSGATGRVGFFVLRHFDPSDPAKIMQQLQDPQNQVLVDAYETGPRDVWCRGRHRFAGATVVVICDEHGGIGWVGGSAFEYARQHTWVPGRQPVVTGLHGTGRRR